MVVLLFNYLYYLECTFMKEFKNQANLAELYAKFGVKKLDQHI